MAKLPSIGLIVVPQPSISMAHVSGRNTSVDARHCPLVFCDVKANARPLNFVMYTVNTQSLEKVD